MSAFPRYCAPAHLPYHNGGPDSSHFERRRAIIKSPDPSSAFPTAFRRRRILIPPLNPSPVVSSSFDAGAPLSHRWTRLRAFSPLLDAGPTFRRRRILITTVDPSRQVHSSVVRYRVFDSYRTPIEITLNGQTVDDDNWHQVVLELSEDRKTITFKVDGTGKQAVSRVVLPSILSPDLRRVQLGINGLRGQFSGCLRRFVINGYLQPLHDVESSLDEYFSRKVSGDVSSDCHVGSTPLAVFQKPGVLASILCVGVLVAAVLAVFIVARLLKRRHSETENTWQRTEEINAYAMHKHRSVTGQGHINHAMTSSTEGPIYASADGYETPIHHGHHREIRPNYKPRRTVADVVLAVRSNPSTTDRYTSSNSSGNDSIESEPPRPAQRIYRSVAYF
ncbi:hypothetical protein Y032_0021g420 [Ancylostoma ceylanicum]|uniref:Laminin G domain-containing protein n=1 Tax=Ancylostoma ceylanicum TaxID=53326 RepID=A0A016V0J7_9BILA|nr:hypothetical protein Y032_0021g420 [Ancylostoma ceylanicum]